MINSNFAITSPINAPEKAGWACSIFDWVEENGEKKGQGLKAVKIDLDAMYTGIYALDGDELIGGILFYPFCDWVYLWKGFVREEYRRHGIYKGLIHNMERLAVSNEMNGIFLATFEFEAPHVYERLGFTKGCVMPNCPKGNTRIEYYKVLTPDE